jgi:hypothetical protein
MMMQVGVTRCHRGRNCRHHHKVVKSIQVVHGTLFGADYCWLLCVNRHWGLKFRTSIYRLCQVKNVDAKDPDKNYKFENQTTHMVESCLER